MRVLDIGFLPNCRCRKKISPAISINKKCWVISDFWPPNVDEGPENRAKCLWSSRCCHPQQWLLRSCKNARSKVNKRTGLVPDSWGAYERNEFSETRGLHLPIHRMPNSLPWYLISDVQTACFLCCKLVYSLTSSPASLEQFSQSYWDAVSQAPSPKCSHQIK